MLKSEILPEFCYEYKSHSLEDVVNAYISKETITGHVERLLPKDQIVVVLIGDSIIAHMPYSEATIYPLKYSANSQNSIPINILSLLGKNIQIKVTRLNGKFIIVSRKASMLAALEHLLKCDLATFHVSNIGRRYALGDIGAGVIGRINIDEINKTHIKSIRESFHTKDIVEVCILSHKATNCFEASYKKACKPYCKEDYTTGMKIVGRLGDPIQGAKIPGFYVSISPQVSGIMNFRSYNPYFKYGAKVECCVTGISDNGLHLEFSKLL